MLFLSSEKNSQDPVHIKRYDFMLQEKSLEIGFKTYAILTAHTSYFSNKDVANFIMLKIHNEMIEIVI